MLILDGMRTLEHPLFSTSSFVVGAPHLRFYAGVPLRGPGGWFVGSLYAPEEP